MLIRIKLILKERKISQKQLAEAAGISVWTLTHQLNGIYKLNVDVLLALCRLCPNLSAEWLLRGNGPMYITDIPAPEQTAEQSAKITLELEVGNDKIIKMRLKDKVIQLAE